MPVSFCNHPSLPEHLHRPSQALDRTPWQCLQSADFWLLWIANGIASGAGLTLLNNLGQQVGDAQKCVQPCSLFFALHYAGCEVVSERDAAQIRRQE